MNRVVYRHPSSGYEDQQQNTRTTPRTLPQPRGSRLLLRVAMQLSLAQRAQVLMFMHDGARSA
jgi:hypothetical protein